MLRDLNFFKNKKILITGHTGFKGAWLSFIMSQSGAEVMASPTKYKIENYLNN